jgi:iron complex transport system substrate-binding protein
MQGRFSPDDPPTRICSLLPSATEIVCALGLFDRLVAVSHECDYPPEVRSLPVITRSRLETAGLAGAQIDAAVSQGLAGHGGLYALDEELLARLDPTLILTQELCEVCAVSYEQVESAVRALAGEQTLLSLEPTSLEGVLETITAVGRAAQRSERAESLVQTLRTAFQPRPLPAGATTRPRVACMEWIDPPFSGGHWVPEMVERAGGIDVLASAGDRSKRITWPDLTAASPDVVVLMPCGYDVDGTANHYRQAALPEAWSRLEAVRSGEVYATDANAYFSRPGPRLARGIEILSEVLAAPKTGQASGDGWRRIVSAVS